MLGAAVAGGGACLCRRPQLTARGLTVARSLAVRARVSPPPPGLRRLSMATMASTSEAAAVYVTVPDLAAARTLGRSVVESKLAACTNIIPGVESIYWWEGKVDSSAELMLMMKTQSTLVPRLTQHIIEHHPYETCEVIALPVIGGSEKYLQWIKDNTQASHT
eukprot:jgi/Chlat1/1392/Chrsp12S01972